MSPIGFLKSLPLLSNNELKRMQLSNFEAAQSRLHFKILVLRGITLLHGLESKVANKTGIRPMSFKIAC